ncbi:MAG: B12-binding domain-containing radical SAM protein [Nitrospinaceae bacterium]
MKSPADVYLADLTHTGTVVSANFFPLAIGYVGAYLQKTFPDSVHVELFKYPEDLADALERRVPPIIGFSNYSWNLNLSYEFIRQIKKRHPQVVAVMGGPNYGLTPEEKKEFWSRYPLVDFYLVFEGEKPMAGLFGLLQKHGMDCRALKARRPPIANAHYWVDGEFVQGENLPRQDLAVLPSPYLAGLLDKFFDGVLVPMLSTTRGCPFRCTFCSEGNEHYNRVSKGDDLKEELEYIAARVGKMKDACLTDANFGMFREDIEKARTLAAVQEKYGWPLNMFISGGKNQKERVMEVAAILNGAMHTGGAMQTTDPEVLKLIKRDNISLEEFSSMAEEAANVQSYTELILSLPGDSKRAHTQSLRDMVGIGVNRVRMYQLIMLPQTEMNIKKTRDTYGMQTRFRLMPRSYGRYQAFGGKFCAVEYEEICVGNNTLPFADYLDCRELDLTVEVLNNGGLFYEVTGLCKEMDLSWFDVMYGFHERRRNFNAQLNWLYDTFRKESEKGLWDTPEELIEQVSGEMDVYLANEEGSNEMAKGKTRAVFRLLKDLHDLLFDVLEEEFRKMGQWSPDLSLYLNDLKRYSLCRKQNLLDITAVGRESFSFDIPALSAQQFLGSPVPFKLDQPETLVFQHDPGQVELIASYKKQYGETFDGLGRILMRAQYQSLIRKVTGGASPGGGSKARASEGNYAWLPNRGRGSSGGSPLHSENL